MDIDALHSTLLSIALVSDKVRHARELCTESATKDDGLKKLLREVETDLGVAKGTLADELGLPLCPRCWPAELVMADADGRLSCPACGHVLYEKAA